MKKRFLSLLVVISAICFSVLTPAHAEVTVSSDSKSHYSLGGETGLIDTSEMDIEEIRNEKVLMYEALISGKARETTPINKTLSVTFQTQQNSYYCGPAAVRMLLIATGKTYSQSYIAGQIGTSSAGTGFGATLVNAINTMSSGTGFSFNLVWGSTSLKDRTVIAIVCGNPVLVNTDEASYRYVLQGHATNGIQYHYGVVNGYKVSGNTLVYTDPAYGMYSGTVLQQDVSLTDMSGMLSTRGYIW